MIFPIGILIGLRKEIRDFMLKFCLMFWMTLHCLGRMFYHRVHSRIITGIHRHQEHTYLKTLQTISSLFGLVPQEPHLSYPVLMNFRQSTSKVQGGRNLLPPVKGILKQERSALRITEQNVRFVTLISRNDMGESARALFMFIILYRCQKLGTSTKSILFKVCVRYVLTVMPCSTSVHRHTQYPNS